MKNNVSKVRLVKSFWRGDYCLKTDEGKRLTCWFKTYKENATGDFVLLETDIGSFVYHKNKPELLFENYLDGEYVYLYKLTEKLYYVETNATDHVPFIWLYYENGEKVHVPVIEEICVLKGDLFCVRECDGKYGIMDENLNWKISPCYDDIYDHINGIFAGTKNETHSTDLISFDENGNVNIVNINGYIGEQLTLELVATTLNRKRGVYSIKGEKILDNSYEAIFLRGNHFILEQAGLYGLADITGKILYDCKYYRINKTETGFELITRKVTETTECIIV